MTAGQGDRGGADLGHDVAAQTRDTHLQSLEIVDGVDLLPEPTAHLHTRVAAGEALQAEAAGELVPELLAAEVEDPCAHLGIGQAEGD
jgi:hypothetical protein